MKEEWRPIKDFPNYKISNFGNVSSKLCKHLKPVNSSGYLAVNLYNEYGIKQIKIHRLVAEAFLDGHGEQVNHIDGNKHNNMYSNLEWCTAKENVLHAHRVLLIQHYGGTPPRKVINKNTGEVYSSLAEAARAFNTSYQNIRRAIINDGTCKKMKWSFYDC